MIYKVVTICSEENNFQKFEYSPHSNIRQPTMLNIFGKKNSLINKLIVLRAPIND